MKYFSLVLISILIIFTIAMSSRYFFGNDFGLGKDTSPEEITNFDECVAAGNPVMESYPEQCRTDDGKSFTRDIGNELEFSDMIVVDMPRPYDMVTGRLIVEGRARGTWFFEATFPLEIVDENNNQLATGFAQAQDEWMTEEFVPFSGKLLFTLPTTKNGTLIIRNANPSGLAENEKVLRIPVSFDTK